MASDDSTPPPIASTPSMIRSRAGLSIQSILLLMFLGVSLLSTVVVGLIGYTNGNDSLRTAALPRSRARRLPHPS